MGFQITNSVIINVKFSFRNIDPNIEIPFITCKFIEVGEYGFTGAAKRGLKTTDFANKGLNSNGELLLTLNSALGLGKRYSRKKKFA